MPAKVTKHSPGEWRVLEVQGKRFVATPAYEGHPYFGRTRFIDVAGDEDYPKRDADLTLIAAAPAMAESLQDLVADARWFKSCAEFDGCDICKAEAVLQKAGIKP